MSIVMRNRIATVGPENDLVDSFLQNVPWFGRHKDAVVFREPGLPTGYPDLVFVYPNICHNKVNSLHRFELNSQHIRVLHHLYNSRETSLEKVAESLNSGIRKTKRIVDDLALAGFVHWARNNIETVPIDDVFIANQIIAVEAKMKDWKSAIEQAVANTWFASQSYILLPKLKIIDRICEAAACSGVGVIIHDGIKPEIILCPQKVQMPGSYGSWIINEWAVKKLRGGECIV